MNLRMLSLSYLNVNVKSEQVCYAVSAGCLSVAPHWVAGSFHIYQLYKLHATPSTYSLINYTVSWEKG